MTDGVIVVISDTHIGGTTALMPPTWKNDDGITVTATRAQGWLWECWQDFTQQVKAMSRKQKVFVMHLGDIIEGSHHNTMQVLHADETSHSELAIEVLMPLLQHASGCAWIRGTPAHAGQMSRYERAVANAFRNRGLVPNEIGSAMHAVFKAELFGCKVNAAHHTRGSLEQRLRLSGMLATLTRHTMDAQKRGVPVADYVMRGHIHHYVDTGNIFRARGLVCPCWQLPTEFGTKVAPDDMPDIGAVMVSGDQVMPVLYPVLRDDRMYPAITIGGIDASEKGQTAQANDKARAVRGNRGADRGNARRTGDAGRRRGRRTDIGRADGKAK